MASAFWTLEDGRTFANRWTGMAYVLALITNELQEIEGAEPFFEYLKEFVYHEEKGDKTDGQGGFIRNQESISFNFDLRSFAPANRAYFWKATQNALARLKLQKEEQNEGIEYLLTTLLDMHKRIKKGEDPMLLNNLRIIEPKPTEKLGPGWDT